MTVTCNRRARRLSTRLLLCGLDSSLGVVLGSALAAAPAGATPPTTLYVAAGGSNASNACTSAANPCATLSYAVGQAASGDTIDVSGSIADNVVIPGTLSSLTVSGISAPAVLNEASIGTILEVEAGASVTIEDLTIEGGHSATGGAIANWARSRSRTAPSPAMALTPAGPSTTTACSR
ncbi:MAG: hypothetical protein ACLQNG_08645 [Acidimicrobiales bacterium]|jgi:hypothetical protein